MIRIIDNFYENPDEVREFALNQSYSVYGNYPGKRTKPYANEQHKEQFDDLLGKDGLDKTKWEEIDFLGNVYNRCVVYEGIYYHSSLDYWGREEDPLSEQRLFQVFFFNTDKLPWCYNDGDGNVWWNKYENEEYEELDYDRIL